MTEQIHTNRIIIGPNLNATWRRYQMISSRCSSVVNWIKSVMITQCHASDSANSLDTTHSILPTNVTLPSFSLQMGPAAAGRNMFCYHCPPSSLHPATGPHPPRLPSLDYPFAPTHPCESQRVRNGNGIARTLKTKPTDTFPYTREAHIMTMGGINYSITETRKRNAIHHHYPFAEESFCQKLDS